MFDLDENRPDYFTDADGSPEAGSTLDFDSGAAAPQPGQPRHHSRLRRFVAWTVAICVGLLILVGYIRYFNPYATDALITGYVANVERRGIIFKTYEAEIISEAALTDTTRLYSRTLTVSIPSEQIAKRLQAIQGTGRRVTLTTERYYGMLPWRGASTTVVTALDGESK